MRSVEIESKALEKSQELMNIDDVVSSASSSRLMSDRELVVVPRLQV
jgi:hypothetical protein